MAFHNVENIQVWEKTVILNNLRPRLKETVIYAIVVTQFLDCLFQGVFFFDTRILDVIRIYLQKDKAARKSFVHDFIKGFLEH